MTSRQEENLVFDYFWDMCQDKYELFASSHEKKFFYIQEVNPTHGNRTEFVVTKITEKEFYFKVVFSEKHKDEIGQLCSNTKENIWDLNKYDISIKRKFK